jgi:hypothetical protein
MDAVATIRDQAHEVGRGWSGPDAEPGWALAADSDLLALAAEIPLDRLPALLFVASVQRVIADRADEPLARYYPCPSPRPIDDAFAGALHHFAVTHADELRAWFGHRYQMNEVGRCTQTALALGVVQRLAPGRRLGLVDVGTGSGIGLCLDRYHVDLGDGRSFGPPDSPVRLRAAVDGTPSLPPEPPTVAARLGIDVAPIDLDDPTVPLGTRADRCVHDLPVDPDLVARNHAGGVFAILSLRGTIGGRKLDRILATAHPSGTRMRWLAEG